MNLVFLLMMQLALKLKYDPYQNSIARGSAESMHAMSVFFARKA
jgi:hypothetical protein